jgi:hypothetical protein
MTSLKKNTNNVFVSSVCVNTERIVYYCSNNPLLQEGDFGVHDGTIRAAKATNSSLPYIVSFGLTYLETKSQIGHVCAGTLIQPDAILTSAREFARYDRRTNILLSYF